MYFFGQVRASYTFLGCPGNESSFSASRTKVGHFIFCAISLTEYFLDPCISSKGELIPVVHIPCFKLNLIFASISDKMSITELTTFTLPSSTATRNDLGNPVTNASYPS